MLAIDNGKINNALGDKIAIPWMGFQFQYGIGCVIGENVTKR